MRFFLGKPRHREVTAFELEQLLREGAIQVVDVREINEFAAGHIPGALNMPLSDFRPSQLPKAEGKTVVLSCLSGMRSGKALDKCAAVRDEVDTHLAGGFNAWRAAGLPVER